MIAIGGITFAVMGEHACVCFEVILTLATCSYEQDDRLPELFVCYKCYISDIKQSERSRLYEDVGALPYSS